MRLAVIVTVGFADFSVERRRVTREDLCSSKWRLPARSCITFPVPVMRKVFFAPLCVFILGISYAPSVVSAAASAFALRAAFAS
ncbi:MAG: hypothetical protein RJA68_917, partial [Actinomycetota bacterium]